MKLLDASRSRPMEGGASFSLGNRLFRAVWIVAWSLLARWTPPPLHGWRRLVLRLFGAELAPGARVHGSARVWYPPNLSVGRDTLIGPRVNCYNQGRIEIGERVVVSQGAHICASSHDISDPHFQLVLRPIRIREGAWIAAEAFVGPGVTVGEGAVLAARGALFRDAEPFGVYSGNPAQFLKKRIMRGPLSSERTLDQELAAGQQAALLLAADRLHVHGLEPARANDLCVRAGVVAVVLVARHRHDPTIAAFAWRVSMHTAGRPASIRPKLSHCDSGPASSPTRSHGPPMLAAPWRSPRDQSSPSSR